MVKVAALGDVLGYMPSVKPVICGEYVGLSAREIATKLAIPDHAIWFFSIAGSRISPDHLLRDGDTLSIHGVIEGG